MELRHLHAFVTVAEERHFGRAAERLGISQPPLSRKIQQLEAELGVKLFSRNARSVDLTQAGADYLESIRPHLEGLERAAGDAREGSRKPKGRVRAGFVSHLAYRAIPRLLASLREVAPGIVVELSDLPGPEQLRSLRDRRIDIGLVFLPVEDPGLKLRSLFREPLVAMLPAGHPAAARPRVSLRALSKGAFVMCPRYRQTGFHEIILDLCRQAGFAPRVMHEASSKAGMTEIVAAGLGLSLVPASASAHEHPGVVYRPLAGSPLMVDVAAVWLEEAMNPVLRIFLDQAIAVMAPR